jgi:hypothetical protein
MLYKISKLMLLSSCPIQVRAARRTSRKACLAGGIPNRTVWQATDERLLIWIVDDNTSIRIRWFGFRIEAYASAPGISVRRRAIMLSSRFLALRLNHPWPDALISPLEWPPLVPAYCCISPDSRLPFHVAPATVTFNANCSSAAYTSSVSPWLMFPRKNSSASGSSRNFSTARRIGRAP